MSLALLLALSTASVAPRIPDPALREAYLTMAALEVEVGRVGQELLELRKDYAAAADPGALAERRARLRSALEEALGRLENGRARNMALGQTFALTRALGALRPLAGKPAPTASELAAYDDFNEFSDELKWIIVGWRKNLEDDAALFTDAQRRVAAERVRRARRRVLGAGGAAAAAAVGAALWRRRARRPGPVLEATGDLSSGFRRSGPGKPWAFGRRWPGPGGVLHLVAPEFAGAGREAERTAALLKTATAFRHPAVRAVTAVGVSRDGVYLVAEDGAGGPLAELLASGAALGLEAALRVLAPVAGALDAAHAAGLVHGSLTPECIRVLPDGSGALTDFGVARALAARPGAGARALSPAYAAPEALEGRLTFASDVFSFGAVLYETLYVRLPFEGQNLAALKRERRYPAPSRLLGRPAPAADAFFAGVFEPSARRRRPRAGGLAAALQALA